MYISRALFNLLTLLLQSLLCLILCKGCVSSISKHVVCGMFAIKTTGNCRKLMNCFFFIYLNRVNTSQHKEGREDGTI